MNTFKVICPICGSDDVYIDIYTIEYYGEYVSIEIIKECRCRDCEFKGGF